MMTHAREVSSKGDTILDHLAALPPAICLPALLFGGSLVMALSAKLAVPFWPVPMTMQVFATFLLVGLFGGRIAAMMVGVYLAERALGAPVFASSSAGSAGLGYLLGPTGGYLLGFAVAAYLVGIWIDRAGLRGSWRMIGPMLAGLGLIYISGCAWLVQFVGFSKLLAVGVLPFLLGDLVKVALAVTASLALLRIYRRLQ